MSKAQEVLRLFEDTNYDDMGDGKYDHIEMSKRIPLHAKKAQEFYDKKDFFNAGQHAREVLHLGATGWIGTPPYKAAEAILNKILGSSSADLQKRHEDTLSKIRNL